MARKTASEGEAAAVAAAIARFEAELAGARPEDAGPRLSGWQRAALVEGISAKRTVQDSGGGSRWLS